MNYSDPIEVIDRLMKSDISSKNQLELNLQINHLTKAEISVHTMFYKNNLRLVLPSLDFVPSYKDAINHGFYDTSIKLSLLNSEEGIKEHLAQLNSGVSENGNKQAITLWLVDNKNNFIGRTILKNLIHKSNDEFFKDPYSFVIGHFSYKIRPDYECRGYGKALMSLAFLALTYIGKESVVFGISNYNKPSLNVANKLNCLLVKEDVMVYFHNNNFEFCNIFEKDISSLTNFLNIKS